MSIKIQLKVFVNSDIAHLVWQIEKRIPHLLGFAVEKRTLNEHNKVTNEECLKSWIGFPGRASNDSKIPPRSSRQEKVGEHRPTTQWPIQEFQWNDHTCLYDERVSYRVIPVIGTTPEDLKPNMAGASDWSTPQILNGRLTSGACFEAYFNRGIVASQWLNILLHKMNAKHPASALDKSMTDSKPSTVHRYQLIADPSDHTRKYLGGGLRHAMLDLLTQVHKSAGMMVYLCLYELDDPELIDYLQKLGKKAHVLLANGTHTPEEPDENARSRQKLRSSGVNVYDRIITASGVLAHNKFVVFTEGDKATMAWTGSTNWTKSGLCTQCNNGLLVRDERLASIYLAEWHHLKSLEGETGKDLRKFNKALSEKASITVQEPGSGPVTIQQW
ncbi:hypothetical protein BC937DRAFT_91303 [Endogone sp. FLAS-F59071]|nr:hypothetical protein BC937DRAFT_91303 [Endogone sp. FLAS-F59071]|eukprot:RUS16357.1 hypothetical protein BC937DRAFT_91303 [Endogone sp. FLAS-F59071]